MNRFDSTGFATDDLAKFIVTTTKAVERDVLTENQAEIIVALATQMHEDRGTILINEVLKSAADNNPTEFPDWDYASILSLGEEHSGRAVMLFFGIGVVAGFYYAMTE